MLETQSTNSSQTRYLAEVDELACVAHGDCTEIAPEAFRLDDDIAVIVGEATPERMLQAAEACPSTAIILTDANTGEQVFP